MTHKERLALIKQRHRHLLASGKLHAGRIDDEEPLFEDVDIYDEDEIELSVYHTGYDDE